MLVQVITVRLVQTQNHGNLRPADGAPARLLFQLGDARRTESLMPTRHKRKTWRTTVLIAYRVLIDHKNTVGGEIWCSFLATHAFLLGNGQTYATRGVPYFRVSRFFMSRIFSVPHRPIGLSAFKTQEMSDIVKRDSDTSFALFVQTKLEFRVMISKVIYLFKHRRQRAERHDTRYYFNVRSKADISQLNLPHGTDN